ncbi:transcription antitermination protein NusB [Patescibacteria group bacterium]|nr:transcription antitermination protein NusB [Patescibacteria group bacterium]MCL5010338.1 transcription antitermination protein NusB [Patescibacteria group bacterium]
MKTSLDPRHKKRQETVQELYKIDFYDQRTDRKTRNIFLKKDIIDKYIKRAAKQFPINKINKVDLAILRLSVFELMIEKKEPPKVIIDEAVELAKEFGGETSPSFVNGALGAIISYEKSSKL